MNAPICFINTVHSLLSGTLVSDILYYPVDVLSTDVGRLRKVKLSGYPVSGEK
jgi:hypothetical protein